MHSPSSSRWAPREHALVLAVQQRLCDGSVQVYPEACSHEALHAVIADTLRKHRQLIQTRKDLPEIVALNIRDSMADLLEPDENEVVHMAGLPRREAFAWFYQRAREHLCDCLQAIVEAEMDALDD